MAAVGRLARSVGLIALVVAPVGVHLAAPIERATAPVAGLIALQAVLAMWVLLTVVTRTTTRYVGSATAFLLALAVWRLAPHGALLSSAVPHALVYLALLGVFTASLAPGRSAIISTLARKVRGDLPHSVTLYTRRVTVAWCCFFAAQLLGSALLFLYAPLAVWSLFVNVLNLPLIVTMFTAEFFYRQWQHPHQPPDRFSDVFWVFNQVKEAVIAHAK
jgi:uncharacterized membrane protein